MSGPPEGDDLPNEASEKHSTDSLIGTIYGQLRGLAAQKLTMEAAGQTLSATALVHEVYLSLRRDGKPQWANRRHFFVASAEAMRRILIGQARRKKRLKRGSGVKPRPLPEDSILAPAAPEKAEELLALNEALGRLEKIDERKAELVSLRFFIGLTIEETAETLAISVATAKRDWSFARAWLLAELEGAEDAET